MRRAAVVVAAICVLLVAVGFWLHPRLVAAGLLMRMEGGKGGPGWLVHYGEHVVEERAFKLPSGAEGRLYVPAGVAGAAGLVLAHGIHEDGIHEPRMVAFARAVASSGVIVLTPELSELAHYRVTARDAALIAEAARALAKHLKRERVGVFGVSFGGGLALRAACEPKLASAIDRVIALGAHYDAGLVTHFFLGQPARGPDGRAAVLKPHGYGATVLFQSLFGEKHKGAISEPDQLRLESALQTRAGELRNASPVSCSLAPKVPLYLVHGLGDRIIPFTESLWNAHKFAPHTPVTLLISPAIVHAEYAPPSLRERLELVNFMAAALD